MVQVPAEPLTLQATHAPTHCVSQQTPSTQKPDTHSPPTPQAWPFGLSVLPARSDELAASVPPPTRSAAGSGASLPVRSAEARPARSIVASGPVPFFQQAPSLAQ